MIKRTLILSALMVLAVSNVQADDEKPNIEPGEWQMTSKVTMEGPFPIPDQEDISTECITQETIDEGMAFVNDDNECEITEKSLKKDNASITMVCDTGSDMNMTMQMDMEYNGDSMSAQMTGDMESPMGPMQMNMTMSGERLGDC
mgnify:CR=1 FL=1